MNFFNQFYRLFNDKQYKQKIINNNMYDKIKSAVLNKGYIFFESGNYNLNLIFERTNDDITNYFTDKFHLLYLIDGEPQYYCCDCTTKPGIKGSIDSPITYEGITGTAIIIPNQYRGSWEFRDVYTEFSAYPYFRQIKGLDYWRDGDKDLKIDECQEQDNKVFGTHLHKMSNVGCSGYPINSWSRGCCGWEEPTMKKILPIIRESVKLYGPKFTATIIESSDIE